MVAEMVKTRFELDLTRLWSERSESNTHSTCITRIVEGPFTVTSEKLETTDIGPEDCWIDSAGTISGSQGGTPYSGTPDIFNMKSN